MHLYHKESKDTQNNDYKGASLTKTLDYGSQIELVIQYAVLND